MTEDHVDLPVLEVELARSGGRSDVTLRGELDLATGAAFSSAVENVFTQECSDLVVDISGLTYCDSSGMRSLILAARSCETRGTRMIVQGAQGPVRRVLEIARADAILDLHDSWPPATLGD